MDLQTLRAVLKAQGYNSRECADILRTVKSNLSEHEAEITLEPELTGALNAVYMSNSVQLEPSLQSSLTH
jgi:transcriptional regulator